MTLQQLKCFAEVAKYRSFARAAEELYISQPAVSHHIRALESELGVTLVERSLRHVALTPAGERFYMETVDMLRHLDAAVTNLRGNAAVPEMLHIGFESTVQIRHMSEIYRQFSQRCPDVSLYAHEMGLSAKKQLFRDGKLDVIFSTDFSDTVAGTQYYPMFDVGFCCVMPHGHLLSSRERITAQDLQTETLIFLDEPNCPPEMVAVQRDIRLKCYGATLYYSTSSLYSMPMIEAGLGVAVMPGIVVPENAHVVTVPFETIRTSFGLLWNKANRSRKVCEFVRTVREIYPQESI